MSPSLEIILESKSDVTASEMDDDFTEARVAAILEQVY